MNHLINNALRWLNNNWPQLALVVLLIGLAVLAEAQSSVKNDPLLLTGDEVNAISKLNAEIRPLAEESNRVYQIFLAAATRESRCQAASDLWITIKMLEPLQKAQVTWLENVRKRAQCDDCLVEGAKLVRPLATTKGTENGNRQ